MKAFILAAGFGTRLGELTKTTPKCLLKAGSVTLLEHVVERLKAVGVNEVVINLHYLADSVRAFVAEKNQFGIKVTFSFEPQILGTGGGLKQAEKLLNTSQPFFVHNADIFSEIDLAALYRAHITNRSIATLACYSETNSSQLVFDSKNQLLDWVSKENSEPLRQLPADAEGLCFCGVQVVSPAIFKFMEKEHGAFSSIKTYLQAARSGQSVKAFPIRQSYWIDIGTPESLSKLNHKLLQPKST